MCGVTNEGMHKMEREERAEEDRRTEGEVRHDSCPKYAATNSWAHERGASKNRDCSDE